MKDTQDVVACVRDFGMFMPMAQKLSHFFKKVYYTTPVEKGFQKIDDAVLGDGFSGFHRLDDFLHPNVFGEIDLFVFPYILDQGLQLHLEHCGKAVWGSRDAGQLERMKGMFYRVLEEVNLPVPDHVEILGLSRLRRYLQDHENVYIKISKYRDTMDTWHHLDYDSSQGYLNLLACKFGPMADRITFYVLANIDTKIEGGIDAYCIDGQWPKEAVLGYEKKNRAYLGTVRPMNELPDAFTKINQAISPILAAYRYRNFFSTEVRVLDKTSYFIDPTCRTASPAGEEMLDLFGNLGDIIWKGAHGELVEPEITARYAGEAYLKWTGSEKEWKYLKVKPEFQEEIKVYGSAFVDGAYWWPPDDQDIIGCIVAIADSLQEVAARINQIAEALAGQRVEAETAALLDIGKELEEAEKQGIEFGRDELPEPEELLPA